MTKRANYADRVEDGELDLSMSDLQEVPVRDIVSPKNCSRVNVDLFVPGTFYFTLSR